MTTRLKDASIFELGRVATYGGTMKYYDLKSIISAKKKRIGLHEETPSFSVVTDDSRPYIEPSFAKVVYGEEKPTIILVSAVGATGKTALAQKLSRDLGLPLFNLAAHKPVGDNTLTGLITSQFEPEAVGQVIQGLRDGSFGILIDGIDEGRSKTTEKGFEAFLDDLVVRCQGSGTTSFVLLGRSQVLDDTWLYLSDKGVSVALITIAPFSHSDAQCYIDTFTEGLDSPHKDLYVSARDRILAKLSLAFSCADDGEDNQFLSFIGCPPVLDSIVTLLSAERNYHKLLEYLGEENGSSVEVELLFKISNYILEREQKDKVIPNIIKPIVESTRGVVDEAVSQAAFSVEEQSARLLAHCAKRDLCVSVFGDAVLDQRLEEQLVTFLPEHPFLSGDSFRNVVFEALAVAVLLGSERSDFVSLAAEYCRSMRPSYHLIYMLDVIGAQSLDVQALLPVIAGAMEFRSVRSTVSLSIRGDEPPAKSEAFDLAVDIEIALGRDEPIFQPYEFSIKSSTSSPLHLGSNLGCAYISLPHDVVLGGGEDTELIAPVEIEAKSISFESTNLVLRPSPDRGLDDEVHVRADEVRSKLQNLNVNSVSFELSLGGLSGVHYPLVSYARKVDALPDDPQLREKFLRLRRILTEFRSHSKGSLARFKEKIESDRVLSGDVGRVVLGKLKDDGIIVSKDKHYHLIPELISTHLGVTWHELRRGVLSETVVDYLASI